MGGVHASRMEFSPERYLKAPDVARPHSLTAADLRGQLCHCALRDLGKCWTAGATMRRSLGVTLALGEGDHWPFDIDLDTVTKPPNCGNPGVYDHHAKRISTRGRGLACESSMGSGRFVLPSTRTGNWGCAVELCLRSSQKYLRLARPRVV
jgi:hypothetical protein